MAKQIHTAKMASSITTSSPIQANVWSGRKRRPIDPEETGSAGMMTTVYDSEVIQPQLKRPRTIDDVLGSLSLRAPDPPGNFSAGKRKNASDGVGGDFMRSAKIARSELSSDASSTIDEDTKNNGRGNNSMDQQPNVTSELFDPSQPANRHYASGAGPNNCNQNGFREKSADRKSTV